MKYKSLAPTPIGSFSVTAAEQAGARLLPSHSVWYAIDRSQLPELKNDIRLRFNNAPDDFTDELLPDEEYIDIQNPKNNQENESWHIDGMLTDRLPSFRWGASSGRTELVVGEVEFSRNIKTADALDFDEYIRSPTADKKITKAVKLGYASVYFTQPGIIYHVPPGTIHRGTPPKSSVNATPRLRYKHWGRPSLGQTISDLLTA